MFQMCCAWYFIKIEVFLSKAIIISLFYIIGRQCLQEKQQFEVLTSPLITMRFSELYFVKRLAHIDRLLYRVRTWCGIAWDVPQWWLAMNVTGMIALLWFFCQIGKMTVYIHQWRTSLAIAVTASNTNIIADSVILSVQCFNFSGFKWNKDTKMVSLLQVSI